VKRVLLDVNVVLDVLLDRRPYADAASAVWSAVEEGRAEGLLSVFGVAPVDEAVLRAALALGWTDFEDAVTAAAARRSQCTVLVTRHLRDVRRSPVRVLAPPEAAAWLGLNR
jgi:predicted nucleic acid-binding protein